MKTDQSKIDVLFFTCNKLGITYSIFYEDGFKKDKRRTCNGCEFELHPHSSLGISKNNRFLFLMEEEHE
jgi:hypothetical protein